MRHVYLISIAFLMLAVSCRDDVEQPSVYDVRFVNHYFESLVSVEIAGNKIENVDAGKEIAIRTISRGRHAVVVRTQSGIIIEAIASFTGTNSHLLITLTEHGKLKMNS